MRCNTLRKIRISPKLLLWKILKNLQFPQSLEQNVCTLSKGIILNTRWHKVLDHAKTLNPAEVSIFESNQFFLKKTSLI